MRYTPSGPRKPITELKEGLIVLGHEVYGIDPTLVPDEVYVVFEGKLLLLEEEYRKMKINQLEEAKTNRFSSLKGRFI